MMSDSETPTPRTPTELDAALDCGAVFRGRPVSRVKIFMNDGRLLCFDLPNPGDHADDADLSEPQKRIMRVLRASPVPLTRKELSKRLRLANEKGRFAVDVADLVGEGKLIETGGKVSDDAAKFSSG